MGLREELLAMNDQMRQLIESLPDEPKTGTKVPAGADLQKYIDRADDGDRLILEADASYIGEFHITKSAQKTITIEGRGRIVAPGVNPALHIHPGSSAWNFRDIAVTCAHNHRRTTLWNLIRFDNEAGETPYGFDFWNCDIHGTPEGNVRRGIALNAAHVKIENCRFWDFHEVGADSQAICGWDGPGPFHIVNNDIQAAGENIMFGGGDPSIPGLVPSNIVITGNHIWKPWIWRKGHPNYAGIEWSIKNLLELKNAYEVAIEGNVIENDWGHSQTGSAILLTPKDQNGTAPWTTVQGVRISGNTIRNCANGFSIASADSNHETAPIDEITIENNLIHNVNTSFNGRGSLMEASGYAGREPIGKLVIKNNTFVAQGGCNSFLTMAGSGKVASRMVIRDNILEHGVYGAKGDSVQVGKESMDKYAAHPMFFNNLIVGDRWRWLYPGGNLWVGDWDEVGFGGDFVLREDSPFSTAATDGGRLGARFPAEMFF
jgi:hypothetical protein